MIHYMGTKKFIIYYIIIIKYYFHPFEVNMNFTGWNILKVMFIIITILFVFPFREFSPKKRRKYKKNKEEKQLL